MTINLRHFARLAIVVGVLLLPVIDIDSGCADYTSRTVHSTVR